MSRTSTTTETQTHLRVVGYDVHPSNTSPSNDTETQDEPTSTSEQLTDAHSESPEWASHYRRIPPYRPVNRNLDRGERLQFINNAERAFITMMFLGVRNNARLNSLWRMTGEKINDQVFGYKIGGEW